MRYVAWISRLGLAEEEAQQANRERDALLGSLYEKGAKSAFMGSKVYTGRLSPGCMACGQGEWSCIFINSLCTADCTFCPMDKSRSRDFEPVAGELTFGDPDAYVEYLDRFGFSGIGFSGGEPLLAFDKVRLFIEKIRQRFGGEPYVWMYTNGDLVDEKTLTVLREIGLDEIRFNICARDYSLDRVELARQHLDTVSVEIPAVPEDFERVKECLVQMGRIGVDHLNLHQLVATEHNYIELANRDYTILRPEAFRECPVFESEMMALRLLGHALDNQIDLSVHYCSHVYMARFQNLASRKRAGTLAREGFERISKAGYISRTSARDTLGRLEEIVRVWRHDGVSDELWSLDSSLPELSFHHSLLSAIDLDGIQVRLQYFESDLVSRRDADVVQEIELDADHRAYVKRWPVMEGVDTSPAELDRILRLLIVHEDKVPPRDQKVRAPENAHEIELGSRVLRDLAGWERLPTGFPVIS